jgi:uncharacterized protein (TIGR03083 family)
MIPSLDLTGMLEPERRAFLDLLADIENEEWDAPTECPAWTVKGLALHVLGDDLSLLSRQRDAATDSLTLFARTRPGLDFRQLLDGFNEQWVEATTFLSTSLMLELLRLAGEWTGSFYRSVDLERPGEPVGFLGGSGPSPYWQAIAREYVERWVHQHQIRRALGRPDLGPEFLEPAAAVVMRSLSAHLPALDAAPGTVLVLTVKDVASWSCTRGDGGWALEDGRPADAAAELALPRADATAVLSRGRSRHDVRAAFEVSGDDALAQRALRVISAMAARDSQ